MKPERFVECREAMRWSRLGIAEMLGRSEALVRRWENGSAAVPMPVAAWIERLARFHERHPPPVLPEQGRGHKPDADTGSRPEAFRA